MPKSTQQPLGSHRSSVDPRFVVVDGGQYRSSSRSGQKRARLPLSGRKPGRYLNGDPNLHGRRLFGAALVVGIIFALLLANTVKLQFSADDSARLSRSDRQILPALRGEFLDRNGLPLAINDTVSDIFIDSRTVTKGRSQWSLKDQASVALKLKKLADLLGLSSALLEEKLASDSYWTKLASKVDPATAKQIKELKLGVVTVVDLPKRVYPDGDMMRGIIGRVSDSYHAEPDKTRWAGLAGQSGLERLLDARLEGRPGYLTTERGPANREIPTDERKLIPATPGTSFELAIDRSFQYQVDKILMENVVKTGAIGGYIGVMDVATGDILAQSAIHTAKDGTLKSVTYNAGVIDTFEPGSPMKVFTMAAALDRNIMSTTDTMSVADRYTMSFKNDKDKTFKDDSAHATKVWTIGDILTKSSNVGTIKVARKVGEDAIYDNLKSFGFGSRTGLADPKAESVGILRPVAKWSGVDIGTIAIGQGISVTPVQLLSGLNTIAANGEYVSPRLVRAEVAPDGTRTELPVAKRRVISVETASSLRSMMAEVVRSGTGFRAAVKGFEVAGKTGTAQKPDHGVYLKGKYVASFGGFFPASAPKLTIVVVLDEPYDEYGGLTAAPVFAQVVRDAAQRYQIAPRSPGVTTLEPVEMTDQQLVTPELKAVKDPSRQVSAPTKVNPSVTDETSPASTTELRSANSSLPGTTAKAGPAETIASTPVDSIAPSTKQPTAPAANSRAQEPVTQTQKRPVTKKLPPRSTPPTTQSNASQAPGSVVGAVTAGDSSTQPTPRTDALPVSGKPITEVATP